MNLRELAVLTCLAMACGPGGTHFGVDGGDDAGGDLDATVDDACPFCGVDAAGGDGHQCVNLECNIDACGGDPTQTTIDGTVYAPNGTLPLYNVIVYVPNAPLDPVTPGVTCDKCGTLASGSPIAVALTDSKGHFSIKGVPNGANIPVVMQVGKWRRQITVNTVNPCVVNPVGQQVSGVEQLTRLPKKQSEGDMPRVAVTTGGCETFACIIPKLGIDPSEYAPGPTSASVKPTKAFSFYSGGGSQAPTGAPPAQPFWSDVAQLKNFDMAMFSCECHEPNDAPAAAVKAVQQYMEAGGRIFTTDFMYTWYKFSPDTNLNASPWSWPGGAPGGQDPVAVDITFPKGVALGDWLYYVSGISPYSGEITTKPPIKDQFPVTAAGGYVFDNVWSINTKYGLEWTHSGAPHPRIISMNMPSAQPPASQCGKGIHLDFHVDQAYDHVDSTYPAGCSSMMREPELVTTFFFFDIASCIQDDKVAPPVPH